MRAETVSDEAILGAMWTHPPFLAVWQGMQGMDERVSPRSVVGSAQVLGLFASSKHFSQNKMLTS
jgi:hypothetical protein